MHQISAQWAAIGFFTNLVSKADMAKQDDYVRYTIRVPKEIFEPLEKAAHESNRSANAEIIARLAYTVANPPEAVEALKRQSDALDDEINLMEGDLRGLADNVKALQEANANLKEMIDSGAELPLRLMHHILNYIDDVPDELAIWAYEIVNLLEQKVLVQEELPQPDAKPAEARRRLKMKRDEFRKQAIARIRKALSSDS